MTPVRFFHILMIVSISVAAFGAETTGVLKLIDGRAETAVLEEMRFESPQNCKFRARVGGASKEYPLGEIWMIEFANPPVRYGSAEQLWFTDGSRLSGSIVQRNATHVPDVARTDLFRSLPLRRELIAGVTRSIQPPAQLPAATADSDVLYTLDGDRMAGRLLRIERGQLFFRSELGSNQFPRHRVSALIFSPTKSEPLPDRPWLLEFTNGDRLRTAFWQLQGDGKIQCAVDNNRFATELRLLKRIVRLGPGVTPFSRMQPRQFKMDPRLQGAQAILVDRGPGESALRIGEREYAFGLFLRPDCEMDYALDDGVERFLGEVGLSSQLTKDGSARVAFAVGEGEWRTFDLKQKDSPQAVALDLNGAKRLRIRVESEDPWGAGAHVVLGEPVLTEQQEQ